VNALKRIREGELKGFSFGGLVRKLKCSICKSDYLKCNHISGKHYKGDMCICNLKEIDLAEISVVKDPINPLSKIIENNEKITRRKKHEQNNS
jgi:phage head maturation protease